MDKKSAIKELFLFKGVDFEALDDAFSITDNTVEKTYSDGELILSTDEKAVGIGIVLSGKAVIASSRRNASPTLRALSAGDTFGAASLFNKSGGYFTSVMSKGECRVAYVTVSAVRELCERVPSVSMNYIEFLSDRAAFLNKKLSTFTAESADARIAYFIYELCDGKAGKVDLPFSYSKIADDLGIGRASLYRALDSMCEKGIIERDSKTVSVISPDGLLNLLK